MLKNLHSRITYAATFILFGATIAQPQTGPENGTVFGDWRLACEATAINQTACAIMQSLSVTETKQFLAEVSLQTATVEDQIRIIMAMTTPTNMLLPAQSGFRVGDTNETKPLTWRTCNAQFCTASRILEPDDVVAIREGLKMTVGYQPAGSAEPIIFDVSLKGVSAGLDALTQ